ncbi:phosphoribosylanthranilate isomerase [Sphingobacterium tabacisoli]|uniref:N-(5'-phosphoribosyl)anthranilate isomerase n=1 Tax=Sphingobacterium tabacisoli TaxID=2044855 RepID=A0ABW5KZH9_9SPHI|nr:phosphoribosylanthranilate isomerase [Sphingobacterium tabacisoli]
MNNIKIKVCGMRDAENIKQLIELPIAYIGFIFYSKSPRFVQEGIPPIVPDGIEKVGVFVNETFTGIMDKVKSYQLQAIQLHGSEPATLCATLKAEGLTIIKAFGIDETFDWTSLESYLDDVDFFLFDTKSTQHGGTGQSFSWSELAHYPYATPYFLSGGLGLDNIKDAFNINDSRLYALDLNSRFEEQPAVKNIHALTQALSIIQHEQVSGRQ